MNEVPNMNITMLVVGVMAVVGTATVAGLVFFALRKKDQAKQWLAGVYGVWCGLEDSATWEAGRAQQSLKSWYGIEDESDLRGTIDQLSKGEQTGNLAWDAGRAIDILRIAMAAGHIDQDECTDYAKPVALQLRFNYQSWEQYAAEFERGMHAWQDRSGINDPQERGRVQRNLPLLRQQVWPNAQWGWAPEDD